MANLDIKEVNQYIAGNRTLAPKCSLCNDNYCYIIVERKYKKTKVKTAYTAGGIDCSLPTSLCKEILCYHYSQTCHVCKTEHNYLTDISRNEYIDTQFKSAHLCKQCRMKHCFIRVGGGGWYFTKICASCLGSKKF